MKKNHLALFVTAFFFVLQAPAQVKAILFMGQFDHMTMFDPSLEAYELSGKVKSVREMNKEGYATDFVFNTNGKLTERIRYTKSNGAVAGEVSGRVHNYTYSADGKILGYDVTEGTFSKNIRYIYDEKGNPKRITDTSQQGFTDGTVTAPAGVGYDFQLINDSVVCGLDYGAMSVGAGCYKRYYINNIYICTRENPGKNISMLGECAMYWGKTPMTPRRIKEIIGGTDGTDHERTLRPVYNEQGLLTALSDTENGYESPEGYMPRVVTQYDISYVYDDKGNWTQAVITMNGKTYETLRRTITYY